MRFGLSLYRSLTSRIGGRLNFEPSAPQRKILACDPLKSDAVGWLSGELSREAVTHEIHDGKMIPRPAK
jgi:hypothetical protein